MRAGAGGVGGLRGRDLLRCGAGPAGGCLVVLIPAGGLAELQYHGQPVLRLCCSGGGGKTRQARNVGRRRRRATEQALAGCGAAAGGTCIALLGGAEEPVLGERAVLWGVAAVEVELRERKLRFGVALLCCPADPKERIGVVGGYVSDQTV